MGSRMWLGIGLAVLLLLAVAAGFYFSSDIRAKIKAKDAEIAILQKDSVEKSKVLEDIRGKMASKDYEIELQRIKISKLESGVIKSKKAMANIKAPISSKETIDRLKSQGVEAKVVVK